MKRTGPSFGGRVARLFGPTIARRLSWLKAHPNYPGMALPDSRFWTRTYYNGVIALNPQEHRLRRRLGRQMVQESGAASIPEDGYLRLDLTDDPDLQRCLEYCAEIAKQARLDLQSSSAQKSFLIDYQLDLQDPAHLPIQKIATSPKLLSPICGYLRCMPVLNYAAIWYSPNSEFEIGRSQNYHFDADGPRNVKAFIPINDITVDSGPLTLLPARISEAAYKKLNRKRLVNRRSEKITDELLFESAGVDPAEQIVLTCKRGEVGLVDTDRCYHFGSRPGTTPRLLLQLFFSMPFSRELPAWGRAYRRQSGSGRAIHPAEDVPYQVLGLSHHGYLSMTRSAKRATASS